MRLHEAIEKAGEGGKIRRASWGREDYWLIGKYVIDSYLDGISQGTTSLHNVEPFIATNWEVIREKPRVYVFEGVRWAHNIVLQGEDKVSIPHDKHGDSPGEFNVINEHKTYTMTLAEETP